MRDAEQLQSFRRKSISLTSLSSTIADERALRKEDKDDTLILIPRSDLYTSAENAIERAPVPVMLLLNVEVVDLVAKTREAA